MERILVNRQKLRLSGHQTFAFRYGWMEKGVRFATGDSSFSDDTAIVSLGVGKNMVESIKYWCEMAGILADGNSTEFGSLLLDENNGWDPFLEDNASLWLLHWKLVTNPDFVTAGSIIFNFLHKNEFSKLDVMEAIAKYIDRNDLKMPAENIALRDIDCYIRSYAGTRRFEKKQNNEESFGCPLQELGLIHPMTDAEMYRFAIGPKVTLPAEIIGFAVWEYLSKIKKHVFRIQEALYHEFSPGQVFMLDENTMIEAINSLNSSPKWGPYFSFTETSGIANIQCTLPDGNELLKYYYKRGMNE